MFEGYLELGGTEVLNSARAVAYAETAPCPIQWLRCPPCPSLNDALNEEFPYNYATISEAPWYDAEDEPTHRFLGAYAISMEGVTDSTREADVKEGITDGGVVGRVRNATRRMRVRAMLTAIGEDALESGFSWLEAALGPNRCSSHGGACGSADMSIFAACPPARADVLMPGVVWNDSVTNLATNPSFESPGIALTLRTNQFTNSNFQLNTSSWSGLGAPPAVLTRITTDGHQGTNSLQVVCDGASVSQGVVSIQFGTSAGQMYTASAYVKGTAGVTVQPRMQPKAGAADVGPTLLGAVVTLTGGWDRVWMTVPAMPVTSSSTTFAIATTTAVATTFLMDSALLETGPLQDYFDGNTAAAGDITYSWNTGSPGAASSAAKAFRVNGAGEITTNQPGRAYRSQEWSSTGTYSLKLYPWSNALTADFRATLPFLVLMPGVTYTVMARAYQPAPAASPDNGVAVANRRITVAVQDGGVWNMEYAMSAQKPNAAGWMDLAVTFTVPPTATATNVYLGSAGGAGWGNGVIYWDQLTVVEGEYAGESFDGSTPDSITEGAPLGTLVSRYEWTGTANASTSTREDGQVILVEDPVEYLRLLNQLTRNLHTVTCVSGPIVEQKLHRGDAWGYVVEFTLVAGTPWVFGETMPVALEPSLPDVIQDVPFNLVPYPSAELALLDPVITATNYSDNPSVEANATNWTHTSSGVLASDVTSARSNALASVGLWSFRTRLVTTNAGSAGGIAGQNTSSTFPAATATTRISVSLWATAQLVSGTAVLGATTVQAFWRTGSTVLRTDTLGNAPAGGGAVSAKSLTPPVGADNVIVRATAGVSTWSAGATVDLYVDASAITVP